MDELLQEVCSEHDEEENEHEFSPDTVANRLKQQEKQQTIHAEACFFIYMYLFSCLIVLNRN